MCAIEYFGMKLLIALFELLEEYFVNGIKISPQQLMDTSNHFGDKGKIVQFTLLLLNSEVH
jgi:hypothetical protein